MSHIESVEPAKLFADSRNLDYHDRVSRRTFGLDNQPSFGGPINFQILCNQHLITVAPKSD